MSIRWLLDAYSNLTKLKSNIMIVPVMISYDRIYEQGNLAREMITGERKDYNFAGTMKQMFFTKENSLGEGYVRYLDPINLENYLSEILGSVPLNQDNYEKAALQLT